MLFSSLVSHPRRHGLFNFSNLMSVLLTLGLYRETSFHSTYCIKHSYTDLCVYFLYTSTFPPGVTSMRSGSFSLHTWNPHQCSQWMHNRCMLNTEQINNNPREEKTPQQKIFLKPEFKSPWFQSAPYHHNIKISNS